MSTTFFYCFVDRVGWSSGIGTGGHSKIFTSPFPHTENFHSKNYNPSPIEVIDLNIMNKFSCIKRNETLLKSRHALHPYVVVVILLHSEGHPERN